MCLINLFTTRDQTKLISSEIEHQETGDGH
jgi:hypothetical protein